MLSGFQEAGRGGGRTSQPSLVPDVVWLQQTGRCDYLLINVALCQPQAAGADRNRPNTSALSVGGLVQRGVQQTSSRPQVWLRPCPRYHTPQEDKEQRSVISRRNSEGGGGSLYSGDIPLMTVAMVTDVPLTELFNGKTEETSPDSPSPEAERRLKESDGSVTEIISRRVMFVSSSCFPTSHLCFQESSKFQTHTQWKEFCRKGLSSRYYY